MERYAEYVEIFRVLGASALYRDIVSTRVGVRVFDCFDPCKVCYLDDTVLLEVAGALALADKTSPVRLSRFVHDARAPYLHMWNEPTFRGAAEVLVSLVA